MFPFIPVDSQTGQFGDWGLPFHGLFTLCHHDARAQEQSVITADRSFLLTNNGVTLGYPDWSGLGPHQAPFDPVNLNHRKFPNTPNSRKLIVPGHTYTRDPARQDSDETFGIDFKAFAIVNNRFIGGFANSVNPDGWVYPAPDGTRWNITANVTISNPDWARWSISAVPYGRLSIPNSFYGVLNVPNEQTGDDASYFLGAEGVSGITNLDETASNSIFLMDIKSDGSTAAFGLGGAQNNGLYENFNPVSLGSVVNQRKAVAKIDDQRNAVGPSIIWEVVLSGTPGIDFGFTIVVARDQGACAGSITKNDWNDDEGTHYWSGAYSAVCASTGQQFVRPAFAAGCGPGDHPIGPIIQTSLSLLNPATNGPIALSCGWTRILQDGTSVIDQPGNTFADFKWWTFTDKGDDDVYPPWGPASREYVVNANAANNGIVYNCTIEHTSDENFAPGTGVLWTVNWEIPYLAVNFDIADVPVWGQATSYQRNDAVREGAADYWLAKNQFVSFSGAPLDTNFDQPNAGENFAAFWAGPFNVLLSAVWEGDKMILEDWIIESTYTDPAIAVNATISLARWKCIRSHVSVDGPTGNKPGVGSAWPQFWEKAFSETFGDDWEPPLIYLQNAKVFFNNKQWEATIEHSATELNKPEAAGSLWTENVADINCRAAVGQLEAANSELAYHVDFLAHTESIDFEISGICAGAFYTEAGVLKIIETDVKYTRELSDTVFDFSWVFTGLMAEGEAGIATGHINRGESTCDEVFTYKFYVDGSLKRTITYSANATGDGTDDWTEDYDTYPLFWAPTGRRTLTFLQDFVPTISIDESYDVDDTIFGGATEGKLFDIGAFKSNWNGNAFMNAFMFKWIDNPYMDDIKNRLEDRALNHPNFPGAGLMNWPGGTVALGPISTIDQYVNPHPFRTEEQIEEGEPFPTLITCWYGRYLVGPLLHGRKSNSGIALDSQYLRILRNDDMPWIQYGMFGPETEDVALVTLTHGSPVNNRASWLNVKDYGDDIACAYDPINKVIHRNSQYRVVYI